MDVQQEKVLVAWISVISNSVLVIFKLIVGLMINSVSVMSEAIHSGVDLLASAVALFAVKTAGKPADEDHPFGHSKIENISGTVEAILIFLAAGWIIFESVRKLIKSEPLEEISWGVWVMLISTVCNYFVSSWLFRVGKKTDSMALQADAWHLRTDVYTSFGVMFGLGVIWIVRWIWPSVQISWVDPVVAIFVALMIVRTAWKLTLEAGRDLLDSSLPQDEINWIEEFLSSYQEKIRGFHHVRTRKSGSQRFIQFHLLFDANETVKSAHDLSDLVTAEILKKWPDSHVVVHIEPCDNLCKPHCLAGCLHHKNKFS